MKNWEGGPLQLELVYNVHDLKLNKEDVQRTDNGGVVKNKGSSKLKGRVDSVRKLEWRSAGITEFAMVL